MHAAVPRLYLILPRLNRKKEMENTGSGACITGETPVFSSLVACMLRRSSMFVFRLYLFVRPVLVRFYGD